MQDKNERDIERLPERHAERCRKLACSHRQLLRSLLGSKRLLGSLGSSSSFGSRDPRGSRPRRSDLLGSLLLGLLMEGRFREIE